MMQLLEQEFRINVNNMLRYLLSKICNMDKYLSRNTWIKLADGGNSETTSKMDTIDNSMLTSLVGTSYIFCCISKNLFLLFFPWLYLSNDSISGAKEGRPRVREHPGLHREMLRSATPNEQHIPWWKKFKATDKFLKLMTNVSLQVHKGHRLITR